MPKKTLHFSTLMFIGLAATSMTIAQDAEVKTNPFVDMLRQTSGAISDDEIREIMAIRERLGGGTKLDLKNFFSDEPAEKPASRRFGVSELLDGFKTADYTSPISKPSKAARMFLRHIDAADSKPGVVAAVKSIATGNSNVSKMRDIARRMEVLAADIEDMELFEDADLLRSRANRIRLRVRGSKLDRQAKVSESVR